MRSQPKVSPAQHVPQPADLHTRSLFREPLENPSQKEGSFWNTLAGRGSSNIPPQTHKASVGRLSSLPISAKKANITLPSTHQQDLPRWPREQQEPPSRPIFKRNRHRSSSESRSSNCWRRKDYDSDGDELWRPPGAIFMKRRKWKQTDNEPISPPHEKRYMSASK